jgi:abortive infection bacteriophage resistance protein
VTVPYTKPPLSLPDQVALLQQRGMVISNVPAAQQVLEQIGYYRFSGYTLPWRQVPTNQFQPGITFDGVLALYEFDRRLRDLMWEAIETIEITLRTRITLHLTTAHHDAFAYDKPAHVQPHWHIKHVDWLARLDTEVHRSRDLFIDHFKKTYDGFPRVPMWVATEVMSFGALSQIYGMLRAAEQAPIARGLGLHERYLPSWIHSLTVVRNASAHHARCWDRRWDITPTLPYEPAWNAFRPGPRNMVDHRIGVVLFIIDRLLSAIGHPTRAEWQRQIRAHVAPMVAPWGQRMGLPADFDTHPLWT